MEYQIQVITVPVTDVDRAVAFYTQKAGFALTSTTTRRAASASSNSHHPGQPARCRSGLGSPTRHPGSVRNTYLVVNDLDAVWDDAPELINTDPYGRGWLFDVAVDEASLAGQLDALLDGAGYRQLVGDQPVTIERHQSGTQTPPCRWMLRSIGRSWAQRPFEPGSASANRFTEPASLLLHPVTQSRNKRWEDRRSSCSTCWRW